MEPFTVRDDSSSVPSSLQMFDSNGRLPMEGFLSDHLDIPVDLCDGVDQCPLPAALQYINLKIPIGFSINPGGFEECLSVQEIETQYCTVSLNTPSGMPLLISKV